MNVWPNIKQNSVQLDSNELASVPRSRLRAPSRPLAFMHVPKAGGTSMIHALDRRLTADAQHHHIRGFDASLFGNFDQFAGLRPSMRRMIKREPADYPPNAASILGHFAYSTIKHHYPNADIVTVLREPTARLLSHWTYWRSLGWWNTRHWGPAWTSRLQLAALPLAQFLSQPLIACQTDNLVTRMLVWPHELVPDNDFIDPAHDRAILHVAQSRLRQFAYADIVERGADMMNDFIAWFGHELPRLTLNKTAKTPARSRTKLTQELTLQSLALLHERSRLDIQLWRQVAADRAKPPTSINLLQETSRLQAIARCSLLLA